MKGRRRLVEKIIEDGGPVYFYDWDSGSPGGGAGREVVYLLDGKYAVWSSDGPSRGPYDSLKAALVRNGLLMVNGATDCISCTCLSSEELAAMLVCDDVGKVVGINDENWVLVEGNGFQREEEP